MRTLSHCYLRGAYIRHGVVEDAIVLPVDGESERTGLIGCRGQGFGDQALQARRIDGS